MAERVIHRRKSRGKVRADALKHADHGDADEHGDQAVLYRGGAGLVFNETQIKGCHLLGLLKT